MAYDQPKSNVFAATARLLGSWVIDPLTTMDRMVAQFVLDDLKKRPQNNEYGERPNHTLYRVLTNLQSVSSRVIRVQPHVRQWYNDYRIAEAMEIAGAEYPKLKDHPDQSMLIHSPLNHQFLAETARGKFETLDKGYFLKLFSDQSPNARYPHIILSASHAHARSERDLSSITHGISGLARDCFGTPLNEAHTKKQAKQGKTLIVMACEARGNFLLEGAALFRRIRELSNLKPGEEDAYAEISPAARRIAKLILACMVTNPEAIDIEASHRLRDIPSIMDGNTHVAMKPNAIRIAQSFMLMGYSKGGNVMSDAARYLADELMTLDAQQRPVIDMRPAMRAQAEPYGAEKDSIEDQCSHVRNLMRKIGLVSKAALEVPMSEHYKQLGVRRFGWVSKLDKVAYANPFHKPYVGSVDDELLVIEGTNIGYGHHPSEAMGDKHNGKRGYAHDNPEVSRRLKEWFAPLFGKAALANVRLSEDRCHLLLETIPNTSDTLFEAYHTTIITALKNAGLQGAAIERNGEAGRFQLTADGLPANADALDKLAVALKDLREHARGLVVAEMSYSPGGDMDVIKGVLGLPVSGFAEKKWEAKVADSNRDRNNWPFQAQANGRRKFEPSRH